MEKKSPAQKVGQYLKSPGDAKISKIHQIEESKFSPVSDNQRSSLIRVEGERRVQRILTLEADGPKGGKVYASASDLFQFEDGNSRH